MRRNSICAALLLSPLSCGDPVSQQSTMVSQVASGSGSTTMQATGGTTTSPILMGGTGPEPMGSLGSDSDGRWLELRLVADATEQEASTITLETDLGEVVTCVATLPGPEVLEALPSGSCAGDDIGSVRMDYRVGTQPRDTMAPVPLKPPAASNELSCSPGVDGGPGACVAPSSNSPTFTWLQIDVFVPVGEFAWSSLTIGATDNGHDFEETIEPTFERNGGIYDLFQFVVE